MAKDVEITVELRAKELGLAIEKLGQAEIREFQSAVADLAHAAYAKIISGVQIKLHTTRADYLKDLRFKKIGENEYLIELQGPRANGLESGYPAFDLKEKMLKSTKTVAVGSRAGMPWVQKNQDGQKYAHVPLEKKPSAPGAGASDVGQLLRKIKVKNSSGRKQRITSLFKDPSGNPLQGKVATATDTGVKDLEGLVKYQKSYTNTKGKTTTQSVYMTYRTVSENSKGWMHPGFSGVHLFEEAKIWLEQELDNVIKTFMGA